MEVVPLDRPRIDSIGVLRGGDESPIAYAGIGETLILHGSGFGGAGRPVLFGQTRVPGTILPATTGTIVHVTVPDDPELQPGAINVAAVREIDLGDPPVAHSALESNLIAFVLVPAITAVTPASSTLPATIAITGTRLFSSDLPSLVWVHDQAITLPDPNVTFTPTEAEVRVEVDGLAADAIPYRVAVRVAGAESVVPGAFQVLP